MIKTLKTILVLTPTLALLAAGVWYLNQPEAPTEHSGDPAAAEGGRLVVLVVFDQMRGDYLERWSGAFSRDGFERLKREGVWYANCLLPYACSATAPGHASLSTGVTPSVHGIIENYWYDRVKGSTVFATADEKFFPRVPAGLDRGPGLAPTQVLAPTLSEALKAGTDGKGRLFSLAIKDRAAVLLGGKEPTGVYCFDNGEFHTSTWYRDRLPAWVEQFNRSGVANQWAGQSWARLGNASEYDQIAGRDDQPGEYAQVPTLPRRIPPSGPEYYTQIEASPFGNQLLWEFAKAAIDAEKLGANGTSDILALSFSPNDIIGHLFGPDSHEVLDVTIRSDRLIAEMIDYLDNKIGRDRYTLLITADHGIAPLPEVVMAKDHDAGRIAAIELIAGLDEALDETFGKPDGVPGRWVEGEFKITKPWVYLNQRLIQSIGVPFETVEAYAAKWLANREHTQTTFRRTNLLSGLCLPEEKPLFDLVRNSFHPQRSGDIYIVQKPYLQLTGRAGLGVDHGSVHEYDRRIFAMALGARVPKSGRQDAPFNWLCIPAMVCKVLSIEPPAKAARQLPDGW